LQLFRKKTASENYSHLEITEEGILQSWKLIYKKDDTMEQYLKRNSLAPEYKYPVMPDDCIENGIHCFLDDSAEYENKKAKKGDEWREMMQDFIERIPEDHYIVSIDCHS